MCGKIEALSSRVIQGHRVWIQANADRGILLYDALNAGWMAVSSIGQNQIVSLKLELRKSFRRANAFCPGKNKAVALQRGQAQTVMNAPLTAGLARFADYRGIQQAHIPP